MSDADDRVELRGMAPRRLVDLLDAVSIARKSSRQDVLVQVLSKWADELVTEASMVMRPSSVSAVPSEASISPAGRRLSKNFLLRAAELLESNAEDLRLSHTFCDGEWCLTDPIDAAAKACCDEELAIAAKLRAMAA